MKNKCFISYLFVFAASFGLAVSQEYSFGMEAQPSSVYLPEGWHRSGDSTYIIRVDTVEKNSGKYSILVEAPDAANADVHGYAYYKIPQKYMGQSVTLRAYMKVEGNTQPVRLTLSMLNVEGTVVHVRNAELDGLTGVSDWNEYTLSLSLSDRVTEIVAGVRLNGSGKLYMEGFEILIDGEALSSASPRKRSEWDFEFARGSKINIAEYTPQMLYNLEILCRIWGFLKYYHPTVVEGYYNWDAELFRIMPVILNVADKHELNRIMLQWIENIGTVYANDERDDTPEHLIKFKPDLEWINAETFGVELTETLMNIRDAKRTNDNFYTNFTRNELEYSNIDYENDTGLRLLALFRYWNAVQYFNPYMYLIDTDWNTVLPDFISKFLEANSEKEYRMTVAKLITHICAFDSFYLTTIFGWTRGNYIATYQLSYIEESVIVTDYNYLQNDTILKIGDMIECVDGQSVAEIIKGRLLYTPGANEPAKIDEILKALFTSNINDNLVLDIIRNGLAMKCTLNYSSSQFLPRLVKEAYRLLTPDIGYVYTASVTAGNIPNMIETLRNTESVVIDMRSNYIPSFEPISFFFLPHTTEVHKLISPSRRSSGMFTISTEKVGEDRIDYYKGRIVIIVNEKTRNIGEVLTMILQQAPNAIVIGNTTAGSVGLGFLIKLPGSIFTMAPLIGYYYPDGRQVQRVGIAIDEEVKPTLQGIIEGRDELLERAIEIIENRNSVASLVKCWYSYRSDNFLLEAVSKNATYNAEVVER